MADEGDKNLHIDSDWKAEAAKEKQKYQQQAAADKQKTEGGPTLAGAAGAAKAGAGGQGQAQGQGQMPPANFETLVSTMATQALLFLGAIPDPRSGQRIQHLDLARHHIDMLGVIEEKTKGNLSDEENSLLANTVYELRQRYIQLSHAQRQI